ncbi:MAG: flagellar hook-basal body protein [Proteobacteria bacterium]|nr:flagellar hook-basal body protein [Pseudomonadota bacterium]
MISSNYNLVEGSLIQQLRFDTLSNNLANVNTTAFKQDIVSFDENLSLNKSSIDFSSGPIVYTGNSFDIALESPGFFKIQTPSGVKYSRDGAFSLNRDGMLVTRNGDQVLGQNGPISISGSNVIIGSDGQVIEDGSPGDKIFVADIKDLKLLKKEGMNYYSYEGEAKNITSAGKVSIKQNYIEKSNVNITEEMIRMIETFRTFESIQKAVQNTDETTGKMVNDSELL